jgi:hypothetical protein
MTVDNDGLYERDEDHSCLMDVDGTRSSAFGLDVEHGMLTFFIQVLMLSTR